MFRRPSSSASLHGGGYSPESTLTRLKNKLRSKISSAPHSRRSSSASSVGTGYQSGGLSAPRSFVRCPTGDTSSAGPPGPSNRRVAENDAFTDFLGQRSAVPEDRLHDIRQALRHQLVFLSHELAAVDAIDHQARVWTTSELERVTPVVFKIFQVWQPFNVNDAAFGKTLTNVLKQFESVLETSLDAVVHECQVSREVIEAMMLEARAFAHYFKARDDAYTSLSTPLAKDLVIQLMLNNGEWASGNIIDLDVLERRSLDNFVDSDQILRSELMRYCTTVFSRNASLTVRMMNLGTTVGHVRSSSRRKIERLQHDFLETAKNCRPLVPALAMHIAHVPDFSQGGPVGSAFPGIGQPMNYQPRH